MVSLDPIEAEECLRNMVYCIDSREQPTKALEKRLEYLQPNVRETLNAGDYTAKTLLPDGTWVYVPVAIERKMSLDELASCFTRSRDRFRREMERACSNHSTVYLLVENGSYEGIIKHRYKSRYNPTAFLASLTAWTVRYNIIPIFCKAETSGQIIKEILYRDIKERLERGEYG